VIGKFPCTGVNLGGLLPGPGRLPFVAASSLTK
jgi:hypothetical protein